MCHSARARGKLIVLSLHFPVSRRETTVEISTYRVTDVSSLSPSRCFSASLFSIKEGIFERIAARS